MYDIYVGELKTAAKTLRDHMRAQENGAVEDVRLEVFRRRESCGRKRAPACVPLFGAPTRCPLREETAGLRVGPGEKIHGVRLGAAIWCQVQCVAELYART